MASPEFFICPECGDEVPVGPAGCPRCNAANDNREDDEDALYDGLDLPDEPDDFDYESFVAEEFGGPPKRKGKEWFWWAVAVVTLIAFALLSVPTCAAA
ncbi:MAG: hypothetical protein HKN23_04315 [Verrucomicrobiales bacterium]|nr:hypothetical protein [Verrucomicrobiales bacterium]